MSAKSVHNLVRALVRPYPGAECRLAGHPYKVWRCTVESGAPVNIEPGKVLCIGEGQVVVKCGEAAVPLIEHELPHTIEPGDYLL